MLPRWQSSSNTLYIQTPPSSISKQLVTSAGNIVLVSKIVLCSNNFQIQFTPFCRPEIVSHTCPKVPPPPLPSLLVLIALQERTKSQSWTCIQHSSFTTGFEICTSFVKGLKPEIQYHYQGNYGNEHLLCSLAEEYALKFQICMIVTIVQRY